MIYRPWSIRNRTRLFWRVVKTSPSPARTFLHNFTSPSRGCSCTFCFYSKRRKFPPGHPMHETQMESRITQLERRQK